ncbi:Septal ring factor EnvC, activator of murein hydrolases AmiA and AmiB [Mucilaginibacter sp. OK268]|uniref:murein hydrolase activator EnvC family protein n=1 Tax=Mucilaginibacter sp. OK268 TaxID=1881048 RepID=UPI00088A740A|nr:peptidoglycan DD-metalloendopeptidase family protein [Mucilaginibacter sp. OK268]SDP95209.1 Septal ring factor EnvC, activator of murein hydrolases AmiA and AmiB [Mucilaginibacter sp. OK268]
MKFLKAVFFIIAVFIAVDVHAQSSQELKRRRDKLSEELEQLNKDYQETSQNKRATLKQLSLLKAQINLREEKINIINSEVRNLDNQISESNNTVHSLQSQLDQLKKEYAAMVLFAYRNQSAYNKLMFLFASRDFNQAYKRLKYLQQFGTYRERQAGYIQGTQKELHIKINELDKNKQEKSNLLADQQKEKETLGKEKNNQVKVVSDLSQHEGQLKQQQREVQAKIAKTNREIASTIRREIEEARRKAEAEAREAARIAAAKAKAENRPAPVAPSKPVTRSESSVLNATPEAAKLSNDFLGNRGRLPWPVANGVITQGFGMYTTPEGIKSESTGIDIRTNPGSSVRAVFDGTVVRVVDVSGTYLVMIVHGEYFTVYANLRSVSVARGQKVSTKQALGTVATDSSTGETEVHFEVYKVKDPTNPKTWLAPN